MYKNKNLTSKEIINLLRKTKKVKRSRQLSCYYSEAIVDYKGVEVKLFFFKTSRKGKWSALLTTDLSLKFEKAYKIYAIRWQIEVFFRDTKQYLGLGKNQSQDFDTQISSTTLTMLQYNILSVVKRFSDYESLGELFRASKAETLELTIAEKLWLLIVQTLTQIAEFLEIDLDLFMEKLLTDNQTLAKLQNLNSLLLLNYRACES